MVLSSVEDTLNEVASQKTIKLLRYLSRLTAKALHCRDDGIVIGAAVRPFTPKISSRTIRGNLWQIQLNSCWKKDGIA